MPFTIARHIVEQERKIPHARGHFSNLLFQIALAAKIVDHQVRKAGLVNVLGHLGKKNVYGDEVQKLDDIAQQTFYRALDHTGLICVMSSEEEDDIIPIPDEFEKGDYIFTYDPLDGSSNIDANVSIGTIFSVHSKVTPGKGVPGTAEDCMQLGRKQVCAGYVLYGSSTMMVYSDGEGVHGFTLDPDIGEFLLSHPNIKFPPQEKSKNNFSVNICNYNLWDNPTKRYVDYHIRPENGTTKYTSRYIGSLVADFHRNLLYGGVFLYPADKKNPQGKLRLLCEAAPLSFIAEKAGGRATTGKEEILDIKPTSLHQRVPLIIGTRYDVERYEKFLREG